MFNDLAKAISFFQEAIEDGEKLIKNCNSETQAELAGQQQHFIVAIAAMQLILSDPQTALRLQKVMDLPIILFKDLPKVSGDNLNNKNDNQQIAVCVDEFNLMLPCKEDSKCIEQKQLLSQILH